MYPPTPAAPLLLLQRDGQMTEPLSKAEVEELLKRVQWFIDADRFHSDEVEDVKALLTIARSAPSEEMGDDR